MRRLAVPSLLLASLLAAFVVASRADAPTLEAGRARRGVAFLSSNVGKEISLEEIEAFVDACDIDFVVVDFAWVTGVFPRTDLKAVERLAKRLRRAGVVVAAMYRPRALQPGDADVHFALDEKGEVATYHNHLCFAHEDSVAWGAEWGRRILEALPSVDHVILYNVLAPCRCDRCAGEKGAKHAAAFVTHCRTVWRKVRPGVCVGHVGVGLTRADLVDVVSPFVGVNRTSAEVPFDAAKAVREAVALREKAGDKPFVPLAKICWASATNNDTEDVVALLHGLHEADLGFVLWYYGWMFHAEDGRYDARPIVEALGGDWSKVASFLTRKAPKAPKGDAKPKANGNHPRSWVYFDSRETTRPPTLAYRLASDRNGETAAAADSVLISYLADRIWGGLPRLPVDLRDANRSLIRFDLEDLSEVERAVLRLQLHLPKAAPQAPFRMAVHRVTEAWEEPTATWNDAPAYEEEPALTVEVPPRDGSLEVDVTDLLNGWIEERWPNHGVLLRVAEPLADRPLPPPPPKRAADEGPWTQPPIQTGTAFSDTIPWADTLEDALERAKETKRLLLVTVVPLSDRRWTSGFRNAPQAWRGSKPHPWGDERIMAIDAGLVKERAMMASLFTDPEIVHLVKEHFVPVRVRLHTYHFDTPRGARTPDPLVLVGTSARELGGPSIVFARANGHLVHACRRLGVLSVPLVRAMLRAVLGKVGKRRPARFETERPPRWTRRGRSSAQATSRGPGARWSGGRRPRTRPSGGSARTCSDTWWTSSKAPQRLAGGGNSRPRGIPRGRGAARPRSG